MEWNYKVDDSTNEFNRQEIIEIYHVCWDTYMNGEYTAALMILTECLESDQMKNPACAQYTRNLFSKLRHYLDNEIAHVTILKF